MKKLLIALMIAATLAVCSAFAEGSLLQPLYDSLDAGAGVHLNYSSSRNDMVTVSDAHAKAGSYCRMETTEVYGVTVQRGTCFIGDTAYSLQPDSMKAIVAISTSSKIIKDNVLVLDDLYKLIARQIGRTDYTTETRDVDGVTYTVEVYPGSGYDGEAAYYFDDAGTLVYIHEAAPEAMPSLGDAFYTVNAVDAEVDESLFDLSAYTIETL